MKGLVLCVCVFIFASSSSLEPKEQNSAYKSAKSDFNTCLNEIGITTDDLYGLEKMLDNEYTLPANKERTKNHGCLIACVLKKQNLMEGTNIKEAQVYAWLNEIFGYPNLENVRKCVEEVRNMTQECEKCFSMYVCYVNAVKKEGLVRECVNIQNTEEIETE